VLRDETLFVCIGIRRERKYDFAAIQNIVPVDEPRLLTDRFQRLIGSQTSLRRKNHKLKGEL
jgi:hypothetical protein